MLRVFLECLEFLGMFRFVGMLDFFGYFRNFRSNICGVRHGSEVRDDHQKLYIVLYIRPVGICIIVQTFAVVMISAHFLNNIYLFNLIGIMVCRTVTPTGMLDACRSLTSKPTSEHSAPPHSRPPSGGARA